MIKLGARLGDPVTVDVSLSGEEVCDSDKSAVGFASVAPRNEQGKAGQQIKTFQGINVHNPSDSQLNFSGRTLIKHADRPWPSGGVVV